MQKQNVVQSISSLQLFQLSIRYRNSKLFFFLIFLKNYQKNQWHNPIIVRLHCYSLQLAKSLTLIDTSYDFFNILALFFSKSQDRCLHYLK